MGHNKLDCFIYSISAFICGLLLCGTFLYFPQMEKTFFDVTIIDVVTIFVMLFLGSFILYRVTVKTTNQAKQNEILLEVASLLQKMSICSVLFVE